MQTLLLIFSPSRDETSAFTPNSTLAVGWMGFYPSQLVFISDTKLQNHTDQYWKCTKVFSALSWDGTSAFTQNSIKQLLSELCHHNARKFVFCQHAITTTDIFSLKGWDISLHSKFHLSSWLKGFLLLTMGLYFRYKMTKSYREILKMSNSLLSTVGQEMFADIIFSRISRILTKPRKYHVREYDFNDLFTRKA